MSALPPIIDPERLGAKCSRCYLYATRQGGPVGPEMSRRACVALVGEAPGKDEVEANRPFIGQSGRELTVSLAAVGIARDDVSIVNAIACRPPGNDLDTLLHRCQQTNKRLVAAGKEPWLTPIEACRPMMQHFIQPYANVITVGKVAMRSVTQMQASIMDMRGAPVTGVLAPPGADGVSSWLARETLDPLEGDAAVAGGGRFIRLLPTVHPAFVTRQRRWTKVLRADLARAFRWFNGKLGWRDPRVNLRPTVSEARDFLYSGAPFYAYDVETDAKESLLARLRCIGFGTPEAAIVVPLLSVDGYGRFYTPDEEGAMLDLLRAWFTDRRILKAGWNAGYYDRIVVESRLGVTPYPVVDGMLIHRNVDSELPHNLAFVGALFTDVARAWKASHAATQAQSDEELHVYNVGDVVVNARIMEPLVQACTMQEQMAVAAADHKSQAICVGLHRSGIFVDQEVRQRLDEKYRKVAQEHLHFMRLTLGDPDFNPNSVLKVRELIFEKWGLPPKETTKLGDPSTNDDSIRKLLLQRGLPQDRADFLRSLRKFRRAVKFRGTFIQPLRPHNEPLYEDDPYAVDVNTVEGAALMDELVEDIIEDVQGDLSSKALRRALKKAAGKVLADGRVHSNWNAHVATTGRLSSSEPNCFDAETEILTPRGWVRFAALTDEDRVAQWDGGTVAFVKPLARQKFMRRGSMVALRNRHINLRVTGDHRCLLRHRKTGELRVFPGLDYPEDWQQIHGGVFNGPGVALSDDEIRFIVAAQADARWTKPHISFGFKKERKAARLAAILDRLGARYSRTVQADGSIYFGLAGDEPLLAKARAFLGDEKCFSDWVLRMSQHQLQVFTDEVWQWDGCATRQNHYASQHKVNADAVQAALCLRGWRAHQRRYVSAQGSVSWQVDVTRKDFSLTTNIEKHVERVEDEPVYCVTVPSTFVVVRRGGEVMVTGNCQNIVRALRGMFRAEPGRGLAACDYDQLELRISAAYAGASRYLEAFAKGLDPHAITSEAIYGEMWRRGSEKDKKRIRDFAKRFVYAVIYGATVETIHETIASAEDDNGNLIFPWVTLRETHTLVDRWMKENPEYARWWDHQIEKYRKHGFLAEPVLGRRRFFLDGEDRNEIINYEVQAAGASCVTKASIALVEGPLAFDYLGPGTGLIQNGHDALMAESPCRHLVPGKPFKYPKGYTPQRERGEVDGHPPLQPGETCPLVTAAYDIQDAMRQRFAGYDVWLTSTPKVGTFWSEV